MTERKPIEDIQTSEEACELLGKLGIALIYDVFKSKDIYVLQVWCRWRYLCGVEQGVIKGREQLQNEIKSLLNL